MEERFKKRRLILPVFIIIVMSFSILSFSFLDVNPSEKTSKYNDKKFTLVNSVWLTDINGNNVGITNDPSSLSNIDLNGFNLKQINKVYLSRDPQLNLNSELADLNNIKSFLNTAFVDSCFEDTESCKKLPLKKCDDAEFNVGVIEIRVNGENQIKRNGSCLKIDGDSSFIGKVIDKIVLETLL